MLTHAHTRPGTIPQAQELLPPTYPHLVALLISLIAFLARPLWGRDDDEEHHPQRDMDLAVTHPQPGANCDTWPAVTDAAAIMRLPAYNVTGPRNDIDRAALRQRITEAIAAVDQRRPSFIDDDDEDRYPLFGDEDDRTGWLVIRPRGRIDDGGYEFSPARLPFPGKPRTGGAAAVIATQQAQPDRRPFSIIAQQCGRFVLTTWGDIYEAPPCMWEQSSRPAQTAASVPVVRQDQQLQEALPCL